MKIDINRDNGNINISIGQKAEKKSINHSKQDNLLEYLQYNRMIFELKQAQNKR